MQKQNTQLARIRTMERALNESAAAADALEAALARYEAALPQLDALDAYYQSPLWLADYDDDRAGRLPAALRRGVLSEDALYDLLCRRAQLRETMRRLDGEA